jgi:hypothetical protein
VAVTRLNIDLLQKKQAEKELQAAEEVVPRAARECYRWLLCPVQEIPTDNKVTIRGAPIEHDRRFGSPGAGARVRGKRTRHCDMVASPPTHQAERTLLEVKGSRLRGRWPFGKIR